MPEDAAGDRAAEWLLDNAHIVERAFHLVREEFPRSFEERLPRLAGAELRGYPLVYALAREIVLSAGCRVEIDAVVRLVADFQALRPLRIAEVWALPILLRVVLLEVLGAVVPRIGRDRGAQGAATAAPDLGAQLDAFPLDQTVSSCIRSLRALETADWKAFFERVSASERILRDDPAGVYPHMDFATRDSYRKAVEELASCTEHPEEAVAAAANRLARESHGSRSSHVGYYLIDAGRDELERSLGYRGTLRSRWQRSLLRHPTGFYLGGIATVAALHLLGLGAALLMLEAGAVLGAAAFTLALVPSVTMAVSLVNAMVVRLLPPRTLPKMDFSDGIPGDCRTMVAVPVILSPGQTIESLLSRLEVHWLANADANLQIALLTDFADAAEEHQAEDDELLKRARDGIASLNVRYGEGGEGPFHLLHRPRKWNPAEGCWMAWERKRGKLAELNRWLRGDTAAGFLVHEGSNQAQGSTRFVITLDADTELPRDSARRLIATLAHPLNRPELDPRSGRVRAGYTILQPRVQVSPVGASASRFTKLLAGDSSLDLYSQAVSDVYQDLFGEGIYVGKGIYDLRAFEATLRNRVPENSLLSHDLFEGIHGRAGLVSDIIVYEDFPPSYRSYAARLHRWTRGDWQLLPWLCRRVPLADGTTERNPLSLVSRWKIVDNLQRSLLPPTLLGFLVLAWIGLPGSTFLWTVLGLLVLAAPVLGAIASGLLLTGRQSQLGLALSGVVRSVRPSAGLWLFHVVFLPHRAIMLCDAIARTLFRLLVSRRHLLQWTSAATTNHLLARERSRIFVWREMLAAPLLAAAVLALLALCRPASLPFALPLALLWLASPEIAYYLSQPSPRPVAPLSEEEKRTLRRLARRTWLFFQTFVRPEDQWLPPDHFQEDPRGEIARRTSPTNIGLLLTATLSAHDFGYEGVLSTVLRLKDTLETLTRMERYRGHFYNWYDTRDLAPLPPRYVSTVDSGNLACCLLIVRQACSELARSPILGAKRWEGLLDTLDVLDCVLRRAGSSLAAPPLLALRACVDETRACARRVLEQPDAWAEAIEELIEKHCPEIERGLLAMVPTGRLAPEILGELRVWASQVHHHLASMRRDASLCMPWCRATAGAPEYLQQGGANAELAEAWKQLNSLPRDLTLEDAETILSTAGSVVSRLDNLLASSTPSAAVARAQAWVAELRQALAGVASMMQELRQSLATVSDLADWLFHEMDFDLTYDRRRRIFFIGYNVTAGAMDDHHYDLLASEARVASLVAIAKGNVPEQHWLYLGRPVARTSNGTALLSWSATMFEYLMPPLFVREGTDTLLGRSCRVVVQEQIAYARRRGVPWGFSESGYYLFDAQRNYQYRAFGVPGLGFKRGLGDDLVVTPYASLLALRFDASAVMRNMERLEQLGMSGRYGFYEAVDFTPSRLPARATHAIVRSFMAHHQAMILLSVNNCLNDEPLVRRFHSHALTQTIERLLYERPLLAAHVEQTHVAAEPQRSHVSRRGVEPWPALPGMDFPQAHVLSNGTYHVVISESGGGYSAWRKVRLTRWQADPTLDRTGLHLKCRDRDTGLSWRIAGGRLTGESSRQVLFHAHMVDSRQRDQEISIRQRVCVAPDSNMEIRYLNIANERRETARLEMTSYAEIVLGDAIEDLRHPAFSKLFVTSEYIESLHALVFHRRPCSPGKDPCWLLHMLVLPEGGARPGRYESSRERFVGRGRTLLRPAALQQETSAREGLTGAVLDPISALSVDLEIGAHGRTAMACVLIAAESRDEVIAQARRYRSPRELASIFDLAEMHAETELARSGLAPQDLPAAQRLLSLLLYPHHAVRAPAEVLASNRLGQSALWKHALSGDLPILLVRLHEPEDCALLPAVLAAHAFWRNRGIEVDLVVLNEKEADYGAEVNDRLLRVLAQANAESRLHRPGGVFPIQTERLTAADRDLLLAAARVVLDGAKGTLQEQTARLAGEPARLPALMPSLAAGPPPEPLPRPDWLLLDNGLGGFSPDGREYVIHLEAGSFPPAPWVNVIANPRFGCVVSESGGGYTWAENSGENRLTPWRNDPVCDEPGEVIYLRDEETGAVWSPTPLPAPGAGSYQIRHGAGYTTFHHRSGGLDQKLRVHVAWEDPVKILQLTLTNRTARPRRVTATYYLEWVLGSSRDSGQVFVIPEYDAGTETVLARNPWNEAFGGRVAFAAASEKLHGLTGDRAEFLGRSGDYARPAGLVRIGLAGTMLPGLDPCAALQVHLDLAPHASSEIHFVVGQGRDRAEALALARKYRDRATAHASWAAINRRWDDLLGTITVRTPEPVMDLMLNRWLLYQTLTSRIWGRTGYYQSGGAFGFRDQLQDAMALLHADPGMCRAHIIEAAHRQFEEGDVLHWWHPPTGAGVRTRCSDDLLWLPFVTAHYVAATGDEGILSESIPLLAGDPLQPNEIERYGRFAAGPRSATLYEHCIAALERGHTAGEHGLPLFGSGDWNDGMNRVGILGRGESVWLGWFLCSTLILFAEVSEHIDRDRAQELRRRARELSEAIESAGWDGEWYRRGYDDNGRVLGSAQSAECRIDSISQSWAVMAGVAQPRRAASAMAAVCRHLVDEEAGLILLLTPPFDAGDQDPGYIKGYPPGVRENGAQYTHAAIWVLWALAKLGEADRAGALFQRLLPIHHTATAGAVARYRGEPYVLAGDVCSLPPHRGRVGWTWYTGAAGWAYRFGIEMMLGIRLERGNWRLDPCIPRSWPGFEVTLRCAATSYQIKVENPLRLNRGIPQITLDGRTLSEPLLPRLQDGQVHEVTVTLGPPRHSPFTDSADDKPADVHT